MSDMVTDRSKLAVDRQLGFSILLSLALILGAALRVYDLGGESYWFDEIYTIYDTRRELGEIVPLRAPAYVLLSHFWMQLSGTSEFATRLLPALLGIGSLGLIYAVGRRLFSRWVGLIGVFLMAVSESQIYHAQDHRYYSLLVFTTLCSFLFLLRALHSRRALDWGLYGVASALLVYVHSHGVFVLAAQNLYMLLRWKKHRPVLLTWVLVQVLIGLAVAANILPDIMRVSSGDGESILGWLPDPTLSSLLRTLYWYLFPLRHERTWLAMVANLGGAIAFFSLGMLLYVRREGLRRWYSESKERVADAGFWSRHTDPLVLLTCWLVCPLMLPFVFSKITAPMFVDRYTIAAAPALYLILAFGIVALRRLVPVLVSVGTVAILILPGLQHYYVVDVKEQWREVADHIEAHAQPGDVLVFAADEDGWQQRAFDWYYQGDLSTCTLERGRAYELAPVKKGSVCYVGNDRAWLIMRDLSADTDAWLQSLLYEWQQPELQVQEHSFKLISVYLIAE